MLNHKDMKKLFVGIDISKDVFDFCLLDQDHNVVSANNVLPNTINGINELCEFVDNFNYDSIWFCMEHTGRYGSLLSVEFSKRNFFYSVINPLEIKYSQGLTRGKNDAVDAYRIASYAVSNQNKLVPFEIPVEDIQRLKVIMSNRDAFVKINVQYKNILKSLEVQNQSLEIREEIKQIKSLIRRQESEINKSEAKMVTIIRENKMLNTTYKKINQIIGVGPITAIKCISETDNFSKFTKGRQFSCHCGLAPFEYQSGSSVRGKARTSRICNKDLKSVLYKAASSAIQHDPQLRNYFNRKVDEGKHKLSVLNAVANKIVLRIFAVANRDEPFVKLYA